MANIRIIDYTGDYDTLYAVILAGPYPSQEAAASEEQRLNKFGAGNFEFVVTDLDAEKKISPERLAEIDSAEALMNLSPWLLVQ